MKILNEKYYLEQENINIISINSKMNGIDSIINGTSKGVYLPISKLQSILVEVNLLANHNNLKLLYATKLATAKIECIFETGK